MYFKTALLLFFLCFVGGFAAPPESNEAELDARPFSPSDCTEDVQNYGVGGSTRCRAILPVYTWNHADKACVKATFSGCDATKNNFSTKDECEKVAAPVCK